MFKSIRDSYIVTSILYILLGLVLFIYPEMSLKLVCNIIGVIILIYGGIKILSYFRNKDTGFFRFDLIIGIIFAVIGGFLLLRPDIIISILPVTIGVYVLFDSLTNLRQALDLKDAGYDKWWSMLVLAVIMIVLGLIMIFNPFGTVALMVMFMGGIFLFRGISNIVSILFTNHKIKTLKKIRDLDD